MRFRVYSLNDGAMLAQAETSDQAASQITPKQALDHALVMYDRQDKLYYSVDYDLVINGLVLSFIYADDEDSPVDRSGMV